MRYTFQNPAAAPMRRKIIRNAGDVPAARSIPQPVSYTHLDVYKRQISKRRFGAFGRI